LSDPAVILFAARSHSRVVGMAALRRLSSSAVELKSMHVASEMRGTGIGAAILEHVVDVARAWGCDELLLETGPMGAFAPARRLYRRSGFAPCEPFANYAASQWITFMRLDLCCAIDTVRTQE
jgi:putative acetyltransferase